MKFTSKKLAAHAEQLDTLRELREYDRKLLAAEQALHSETLDLLADCQKQYRTTCQKLSQVQDAEAQQAREIKRLKDMISQYAIDAYDAYER